MTHMSIKINIYELNVGSHAETFIVSYTSYDTVACYGFLRPLGTSSSDSCFIHGYHRHLEHVKFSITILIFMI